jgi:hypothetical protein
MWSRFVDQGGFDGCQRVYEAASSVGDNPSEKEMVVMLADVLVALLIVVVAAVLGLVVHPLLWFIAVLAVIYLFTRHGGGRRSHSAL